MGAPVSAVQDYTRVYPSATAAAIAALRAITGHHDEHGGGILYNPKTKQYVYTAPVGIDDDAHFSAAIQYPDPWQLAGLYHTHPSSGSYGESAVPPGDTEMFSPNDVDVAKQLKVPSYILSYFDNKIRSYDPKIGQTSLNAQFGGVVAPGDVVDESTNVAPARQIANNVTQPSK